MVSFPEKLLENDGTQVTPVSNLASTPGFHFKVRLGATWVPSLKRAFQDPQPVDGCVAVVSWAFAFERRPLIRIFTPVRWSSCRNFHLGS